MTTNGDRWRIVATQEVLTIPVLGLQVSLPEWTTGTTGLVGHLSTLSELQQTETAVADPRRLMATTPPQTSISSPRLTVPLS